MLCFSLSCFLFLCHSPLLFLFLLLALFLFFPKHITQEVNNIKRKHRNKSISPLDSSNSDSSSTKNNIDNERIKKHREFVMILGKEGKKEIWKGRENLLSYPLKYLLTYRSTYLPTLHIIVDSAGFSCFLAIGLLSFLVVNFVFSGTVKLNSVLLTCGHRCGYISWRLFVHHGEVGRWGEDKTYQGVGRWYPHRHISALVAV